MDDGIQKVKKQKRRLNRLFVGSIAFVELLILLIIAYSILRTITDEISVFSVIALSLILIWIGVVIGYLAWANYFYNINLGLTNESWKELKLKKERAEEMRAIGEDPGEITELPEDNPYNTQSMGLPPGTIRATLTLTLMIGAISLFIYSMGNSQIDEGKSFIYDNFEFFKTAFLMMIAFYFGSRSLEILQNKSGIITKRFGKKSGETKAYRATGTESQPEVKTGSSVPSVKNLSKLKSLIKNRPLTGLAEVDEAEKIVEKDYTTKELTRDQIIDEANAIDIEPASLLAAAVVESADSGFLPDGRPKILFEGHKFWKHISDKHKAGKLDFGPEKFATENPEILYPSYTRKHYLGGTGEYTRLEKAKLIDRDSALLSTSWGKFQILGENYKLAGFDTIDEFVDAHQKTGKEHLDAFIRFISNARYNGTPLIEYLKNKDWQKFARGYNGPAYASNQYDLKLEESYARFATELNQKISATLNRLSSSDVQTTGEMILKDNADEIYSCKTLELPWRNNNINISCIPPGKYKVIKRYSEKYRNHFHVLNVPGRSMILIHAGNYYTDTRGCILVGKDLTDINADGFRDVTASRLTLAKLNQLLPERFELTINNHA